MLKAPVILGKCGQEKELPERVKSAYKKTRNMVTVLWSVSSQVITPDHNHLAGHATTLHQDDLGSIRYVLAVHVSSPGPKMPANMFLVLTVTSHRILSGLDFPSNLLREASPIST